jgi:hypothetical protein
MSDVELLIISLGLSIIITQLFLVILAFMGQRMVEEERQKKYYVEFVDGRYVLLKKKKTPNYLLFND